MYCNNRECGKTHCVHHQCNHDKDEEVFNMNEGNTFKCANYKPKYTFGSRKKPTIEVVGNHIVEYFYDKTKKGGKDILNVHNAK